VYMQLDWEGNGVVQFCYWMVYWNRDNALVIICM
jgi:hypothetical protein